MSSLIGLKREDATAAGLSNTRVPLVSQNDNRCPANYVIWDSERTAGTIPGNLALQLDANATLSEIVDRQQLC